MWPQVSAGRQQRPAIGLGAGLAAVGPRPRPFIGGVQVKNEGAGVPLTTRRRIKC